MTVIFFTFFPFIFSALTIALAPLMVGGGGAILAVLAELSLLFVVRLVTFLIIVTFLFIVTLATSMFVIRLIASVFTVSWRSTGLFVEQIVFLFMLDGSGLIIEV